MNLTETWKKYVEPQTFFTEIGKISPRIFEVHVEKLPFAQDETVVIDSWDRVLRI
jgi:hypothetical protein